MILLEDDEWLYLVNLYGQLSNDDISGYVVKYKRVIVDQANDYFAEPIPGVDTFYTCRKWFGVADGAFLYTDKQIREEFPQDESYNRMEFLLGRFELTASDFYAGYNANNNYFRDQPIKRIELELALCGYFEIITSDKMTAKEALEIYKGRDASEKLFLSDKTFLGNHCLRVGSDESADSKIFIEFVALIIRNRMYNYLMDEKKKMTKKPNYMTVPAAIRELDKIEMARLLDGVYRFDHAITATQKTILKAFGMTDDYVKHIAEEVSLKLKSGI